MRDKPYYSLHTEHSMGNVFFNLKLISQYALDNKLSITYERNYIIIDAHLLFSKYDSKIVIEVMHEMNMADTKNTSNQGSTLNIEKVENTHLNWLGQYLLHMFSQMTQGENVILRSHDIMDRKGKVQANNFHYLHPYKKTSFFKKLFKESNLYDKLSTALREQSLLPKFDSLANSYYQTEINQINPYYLTPVHYVLSMSKSKDPHFICELLAKLHSLEYLLYPHFEENKIKSMNSLIQERLKEPILVHAIKCGANIGVLSYLVEQLPDSEHLGKGFLEKFLDEPNGYSHEDKILLINTISNKQNVIYDYDSLINHLRESKSIYTEFVEKLYLNQSMSSHEITPKRKQKI